MVLETIGTQKIITFGTPIHCFYWWRVTKWTKLFTRLVRRCHAINLKCNNSTITFVTWYQWLHSSFVICNRLSCKQIYNVPTILENIRSRAGRDRMIIWLTNCICNQWLSQLNLRVHGEVYSIQHYMIKVVSDLRQVSGFPGYPGFLHQKNWPPR